VDIALPAHLRVFLGGFCGAVFSIPKGVAGGLKALAAEFDVSTHTINAGKAGADVPCATAIG
jgi:hypothetical protein